MMGCLFEIFFEILIEGILSLVMSVYLKVAYILVPNKEVTEKEKDRVKNIITTVSAILVLILFIVVILLLSGEESFSTFGKYMTFIPLSVIGLQIILSVVVLIVRAVKRRKK